MQERKDWVIRKAGYFYRPNRCGYTQEISAAGRYTEVEARAEATIEPWRMSAHHVSEFDPPLFPSVTEEELVRVIAQALFDATDIKLVECDLEKREQFIAKRVISHLSARANATATAVSPPSGVTPDNPHG